MIKLTGKNLIRALKGKNAAVLGLGRSGLAAAKALKRVGAKVFLSESAARDKFPVLPSWAQKLPSEFGGHTARILEQDLIVVSPGIHLDIPPLLSARKKRIPILSELELGWRLGEFKRVAAVTGTNGKTTTVSLLGDICRKAGLKTLVAGNIGSPLCGYYEKARAFDATVLEVSSYQLESSDMFRPDVACVLNVTPDHLERHHDLASYAKTKERIFRNQTSRNTSVINWDDAFCGPMARRCKAPVTFFSTRASVRKGVFYDKPASQIKYRMKKEGALPLPVHLPGLHNIENACAASACALALGVKPAAIAKSLKTFRGVPHRLETVRDVRGIHYINDSKATNVDSTVKALEAMGGPLWLILGGQDKGSPYAPLKPLIQRKVKGIFLIGEASQKIERELEGAAAFFRSETLEKAVRDSFERARRPESVLLSPACASFDQFRNFEDRGDRFKALVRELKE